MLVLCDLHIQAKSTIAHLRAPINPQLLFNAVTHVTSNYNTIDNKINIPRMIIIPGLSIRFVCSIFDKAKRKLLGRAFYLWEGHMTKYL